MAITTYSELKSAIADFLNRDDLTSVIPTFITLVEDQINRDLRHWEQQKRVTTTLDERYEYIPNDWIETVSMTLDTGRPLRLASRYDMAAMREKDDVAGEPAYYTHDSGQFEFYPTPDDSYTLTVTYTARIYPLSDTDDTNWLLSKYPAIYLYGAMVHASAYLKDSESIAMHSAMYQQAIDAAQREGSKAQVSGSSLRMRF
jgi:hypothetical protein